MSNKLDEARAVINDIDAQMADLFVQRMEAAKTVYEHKKAMGLPILDSLREAEVVERNAALVEDPVLKSHYVDYIRQVMAISRDYQSRMQMANAHTDGAVVLSVKNGYDVVMERGILARVNQHLHLNRRVLVVTDSGVPQEYAQTVAEQCTEGVVYTIPQGEAAKNLETFGRLLQTMLDHGFSRKDCVVAVGGGVVGDLAGFAAATYMRGVDFYNIPTTLLAQIDSSIGGKTAIDFGGVKNVVGAFYQPKKVLIDPELLKTLPQRQLSNGLAEAIKMALTSDKELFERMEKESIEDHLDEIILRCLVIKKDVVEQDEKETGLRKVLNFGHTIGHGIESCGGLYHGECVALGLLPMCGDAIRPRVVALLQKCRLYRQVNYDWDAITKAAFHDKKADGDTVTVVTVSEIGRFEMKTIPIDKVVTEAKNCLEGLKV